MKSSCHVQNFISVALKVPPVSEGFCLSVHIKQANLDRYIHNILLHLRLADDLLLGRTISVPYFVSESVPKGAINFNWNSVSTFLFSAGFFLPN